MLIDNSITHRIERAVEKAMQLRINQFPMRDKNEVMNESLAEFNKYFEGIYKIDALKLKKNIIDISIIKYDDPELTSV